LQKKKQRNRSKPTNTAVEILFRKSKSLEKHQLGSEFYCGGGGEREESILARPTTCRGERNEMRTERGNFVDDGQ